MKKIWLTLVFVSLCVFAKAQNNTSVNPIEFKLGVGESQLINNVEVTFLRVMEDSRCPKDVSCVWAGQAKIMVRISEKGKKYFDKEIIMSAFGKNNVLHVSDELIIKAIRLTPYPKTNTAANNRVYYKSKNAQEIMNVKYVMNNESYNKI